MRRAALAGGLVVLLLGALLLARPFMTRDRDLLAATPQPPSLFVVDLVVVRAGQQACLDRAVIDERSEQARFGVGTYSRPGQPLSLTIRGAGYDVRRRIPGAAYVDNDLLRVPIQPPGSARLVTICIRNEGRRKIALFGSRDTLSRSKTRVDGAPIEPNIAIAFAERRPASLIEHLPVILRRLTVFRPVGHWLMWPLAILFALAIPAGVMFAYVRSAGSIAAEDEQAGEADRAAGGYGSARDRLPRWARHPLVTRLAAKPAVWLVLIMAVVFLIGLDYTRTIVQYFVMPDELGYVKQASHIASSWWPSTPGDMWFNSYAQLWPLVMAPAYGLFATPTAFAIAHVLAAAAIASAAIPAYLLAARVVQAPVGRVLAAALTVTVPWLAFSGSVMTESLAYPLFVWALLACCVAIERPSPLRDLLALLAIGLAFVTRPQLAALAPAFAAAVAVHEVTFTGAGRWSRAAIAQRVKAHAVLVGAVAAGVLCVVVGVSSQAVLGSYGTATEGGWFVDGMVAQGRELLAYVALGVAVLPLALAPAWIALSLARPRDAAAHALAALSLATIVVMVAVTASFSVRFAAGINDRYLFFIAPLLVIGTVALLFDRRPATPALILGGGLAAAILASSVMSAAGPNVVSPTYAINTVVQGRGRQLATNLGLDISPPTLLAALTVAAVLGLAFARWHRPGTSHVAIGVCVALLLVTLLETRYALNVIGGTQAGASQAFRDGRDWVDRTVPGDERVGAVLSLVETPEASVASWWDVAFWNKRVDRAWQLPGTQDFLESFTRTAVIDPRTGRMPALDERSLLVIGTLDRRFALRGARTVQAYGPFVIVRAPRPYHAAWMLQAARNDGLLSAGGRARLTLFGDGRRARRLRLVISATATPDATRGYRLVARDARGRRRTVSVPRAGHGTIGLAVRVPASGPTTLQLTLRGPADPRAPAAGVVLDPVLSPPA